MFCVIFGMEATPFTIHRMSESKVVDSGSDRYQLRRLEFLASNGKDVLWTIFSIRIPPTGQTRKFTFPKNNVIYTVNSYMQKGTEMGSYVLFIVDDEFKKVRMGEIVLIEANKGHIITNPNDEGSDAIITMQYPGKLRMQRPDGTDMDEEQHTLDKGVVEVENKSEEINVPRMRS